MMKIKIFSDTILDDKARQKNATKLEAKNKANEDIEHRVNQFIAGKKVIDVKTALSGDALGLAHMVVTVLYED